MARRRFQFDDGRSSKFWEIEVKDNRHVIRYGKLGTAGRLVEKQFTSKAEARTAAEQLIREKTRKGYREVTQASSRPQRPATGTRLATGPTTSGTRILSEAVYREAEKKGADIHHRRELPKSVKRCPILVAEFYQNIIWPRRLEFTAEFDEIGMRALSFSHPVQEFHPEAYGVVGCEGMDLFAIGSHNGGNWILLLDGNDKRKSDPTVYEVDHHPEPGDTLWNYGRLSKFLRSLESSA